MSIVVFSSRSVLEQWLQAHNATLASQTSTASTDTTIGSGLQLTLDGVVSIPQIIALSECFFANRLRSDFVPATLEKAKSTFSFLGLTGPMWDVQ